MSRNPIKIGVLISGSGTNLQAIIDRCADGFINGEVVCVISNKSDAFGLKRAEKAGIPAYFIDHRKFGSRSEFDKEIVSTLKKHGVKLLALAGFMRIVTPEILSAFPDAVINIHPAILPSFPGIDAHRQAVEYGVRVSGCTVHFVDSGCDTGPIILQSTVPVLTNDTPETLAARIHIHEHRLYPEEIRLYAEGKLKIEGRKVVIL